MNLHLKNKCLQTVMTLTVTEPRTELMSEPNEIDYDNLKLNAKAKKARKKFVPQQWHIRSHGDVRMRLGKKFKITGKRVPENPDLYSAWVPTPTNYTVGTKVKRNVGGIDIVYQSIKDTKYCKYTRKSTNILDESK